MAAPWATIPAPANIQMLSQNSPTATTHRNGLWLGWVDTTTQLVKIAKYSLESGTPTWSKIGTPRISTTEKAAGSPALLDFNGELQLVYRSALGQLLHFRYLDFLGLWTEATTISICGDNHLLAAVNGQLYCVSTKSNSPGPDPVYWTSWNPDTTWSDVQVLVKDQKIIGKPALFVLGSTLYFIGLEPTNKSGKVSTSLFEFTLEYGKKWNPSNTLDRELLGLDKAIGISVCTVINTIYLALRFDANPSMKVYVKDGAKWGSDPNYQINLATHCSPVLNLWNDDVYCTSVKMAGNSLELTLAKRPATKWGSLSSWMQHLDQNKKISEVNLPGTHDSLATGSDLVPGVICQRLSIEEQLKAGIRYFDLRIGVKDAIGRFIDLLQTTQLSLVGRHGPIALGSIGERVLISDILSKFYKFLEENPTEGLILQVKVDSFKTPIRDKVSGYNLTIDDNKFSPEVATEFTKLVNKPETNALWLTDGTIPTVAALRGKILLVRRYPSKGTLGIDVSAKWPENGVGPIDMPIGIPGTQPVKIWIQDHYNLSGINSPNDAKFSEIRQHLELAKAGQGADWYINYSSGFGEFAGAKNMANVRMDYGGPLDAVNSRLAEYFRRAGSGKLEPARYGTIVMDYPDRPQDLILAIIATNQFIQ